MKLDPKLERRLQELAREKGGDLNAVLAAALGVCPTCGQVLPLDAPVRRNGNAESKPRGRKADPNSKSTRIRQMLADGVDPGKIAKEVGATRQYVYNMRSRMRPKATAPRGE